MRMLVLLLLAVGATRCRVPPPEVAPGPSAAESVRFLTSDPAVVDYWPCFSPDGRVVIFSRSFDDGKTWALFTVAVTGGTAARLVGPSLPASPTRPNWSLRGGRIAFTAEEPNEKATVWIMTPDGSQVERVVAAGLSDNAYYPSWYPDAQHLVVVDFAEDDQGVVKRIDLVQHTATAMTSAALILAGMPSVSPDGKRIAFAGQENLGQAYDETRNSIWLLEEGGVPENVSSGQGRTPAWSPDAQWLAFESNRTSNEGLYAVFTVRPDGSSLRQVTDYRLNANHPVWSPDGKLLVFSGRHRAGLAATGVAVMQVQR